MRKPVYKVVTITNTENLFKSACVFGKYCKTYQLNKITEKIPKTNGIFCFDTLENARKYKSNTNLLTISIILECLPIGRKSRSKRFTLCISLLDYFYSKKLSLKLRGLITSEPMWQGTVCYPAVKPLKIVGE